MSAEKLITSIKAQAETHCFDPLARARYEVELLQGVLRTELAPRTATQVAEREGLKSRALELLTILFDRDCRIYAHELTIPMHSHRDAVRTLMAARDLINQAKAGS